MVGLAFDFCVGSTALDAKKYGFDTYVVAEGTKSVSKETESIMHEKLKNSNIPVISFDFVKWLDLDPPYCSKYSIIFPSNWHKI